VPQFTVYRNKSPRTKSTFPFLVDVQSDLLDQLQTRVVIPLTRTAGLAKKPLSHLTPALAFDGESYVLMTPQLAGVARTDLGTPAGSLAGERQAIVAAMDFLLAGY
jgi:toxin CcdB